MFDCRKSRPAAVQASMVPSTAAGRIQEIAVRRGSDWEGRDDSLSGVCMAIRLSEKSCIGDNGELIVIIRSNFLIGVSHGVIGVSHGIVSFHFAKRHRASRPTDDGGRMFASQSILSYGDAHGPCS